MPLFSYLTYLAGSDLRLVLYFILGGSVVALSTYLAGRGQGTLSAFVSNLPLLTGLTFLLIRAEGGSDAVREYARGLLIFTPPWLCYVAVVMLGTSRIGIFKSVGLGILLYIVLSGILLGAKL